MFDPRDPNAIPTMVNLATKPIVILGNGTQIDRMQAAFWDRLNAIQQQADSELVVVGVNRIGIADACLKHRYKPDVIATVDRPVFRPKTTSDLAKEHAAIAADLEREDKQMRVLKTTNPKAYEIWEATKNQLFDARMREHAAKQGGKVEQVPTPVTDAFARSFHTCAGVCTRLVSPQAVWFLQPSQVPGKDVVLNLDTSLTGPPDRAKMLFTTADWVVNWLARMGCREFYFYGVSMRDGGHCKTLGLEEDDDYSWSEPGRQHVCFKAWDALRDAFPGLKLYNCDRKALFVEKGVMEFKTPPQLDKDYQLLTDEQCLARRDEIMAEAKRNMLNSGLADKLKKAKEDAEIARLKAAMEADKARVSA